VELRQLVYFEAVARHASFTRAAEALHIAQPAVSAQVRQLERELGTPLLERTTRRVALTHAGDLFLAHARSVLAELDNARTELNELSAVLRGRLRLGVTPVLGPVNLPSALAVFHRNYPEVALSLRSGLIADLLHHLDRGVIDMIIGPIHDELPARFITHRLAPERLVMITPPGTRKPARTSTLAVFRDEEFVCLPEGSVPSRQPSQHSRPRRRRTRRGAPGRIRDPSPRARDRRASTRARPPAPANRNDPSQDQGRNASPTSMASPARTKHLMPPSRHGAWE
jgi:LysR family transcriptional activator of glutamate synthase operon